MSAAAVLLPGPAVALQDYPVDCAWSRDGRALLVAGGEGRLVRIDTTSGDVSELGTHAPGLLSVAWPGDDHPVVTAGQDGTLRLWRLDAAAGPVVVHRAVAWASGLAWSPKARRFAAAIGRNLCVFEPDGQPVRQIGPCDVQLTHAAWRGEDELLAAGSGALFVCRVSTGDVEKLSLEGGPLTLVVSPDLKIVASGMQDGHVYFRYLATRKKSKMSGYDGKVDQTAWSANSRYLATAASGSSTVVAWDFGGKGPEGSDPIELVAHADRVTALAWQPGGPLLASGGRDGRVALWRPNPGTARLDPKSQLRDSQLLEGEVGLLRWSPDGRRLVAGQADGTLRLFGVKA